MGATKGKYIVIRVVSETGYTYTTRKNPKTTPEKLELMKYDPNVRKRVLFKEKKFPSGKK